MSRLNLDMTAKIWRSALPKGCNKLVLQCLVSHLNDESGLSWASIGRIALMCGLSERTVQCHLRVLQAAGLIRPRLRTGRTTHYSAHLESLVPLVFPARTVVLNADGQPVDNSAVPPAQPAENDTKPAKTDTQPAENDIKPVEICTLTVDITSKSTEERTSTPAPALPVLMMMDGINPKVLADFAAIRKTKRKGPVTDTLVTEICQQAAMAGMTLEQALKTCCTRNWARFEAAWLHDSGPGAATPSIATITTPAAPASPPPEPVKPAAPEVVAAALAAYRAKPAPAAAPAMPTGDSDITIAPDAPPWAVGIVNKQRTGQYVNRAALNDACAVLKIDPAILRRASTSTATAARMH